MEPIRAQHPPLSILISGPAAAHHAAVSAGMHNVPTHIPTPVHPVHPQPLHDGEPLTKQEAAPETEYVGPVHSPRSPTEPSLAWGPNPINPDLPKCLSHLRLPN